MSRVTRWGWSRVSRRIVRPEPLIRMKLGCRANAGDEVVVDLLREATMEPVSRPAAGRTAAATSEIMDVTAGETAPAFAIPRAHPKGADMDSGLNASAPEGTNGGALGGILVPVNADECPKISSVPSVYDYDGAQAGAAGGRAAPACAARIALPKSSLMDDMRLRPGAATTAPAILHAPAGDKVWCETCQWHKPLWFGIDCIEGGCALKGRV